MQPESTKFEVPKLVTLADSIKNAVSLMRGGLFTVQDVNDPWDLAGDRHKGTRVAVMAALCGKKQPVSKCGVNAIINKFAEVLQVPATARHVTESIGMIREIIKERENHEKPQ